MLDSVQEKQVTDVLLQYPDKLILSNPDKGAYIYKKTVFRKVLLKGKEMYQVEQFTDKQVFHENVESGTLVREVLERFPSIYKQLNLNTQDGWYDFKLTKKGKLLSNVRKAEPVNRKTADRPVTVAGAVAAHNRKKQYRIEEGTIVPPLVDLGIFTKDGRVVRTMYDKYRQINRFIELVEDVIKDYPRKRLHIIDFGCGKSYLTFILYYYLVELCGYEVEITGLDLKEAVIEKCNATAKKYGYEHLHFEKGDINGYQTDVPVDMVITLHACDTATDYALYNAIRWNAGIILSVPCCQHELNAQIKSDTYGILTRYGIVKERMAALMTDTIRANVLEYSGYKTQLLEFIDIAHSPKNLLIRAVKGKVSDERRKRARQEIENLSEEFHLEQTLAKLVIR